MRTRTQHLPTDYKNIKKVILNKSFLWRALWVLSFLLTFWSFYPGHMDYGSYLLLKQARSSLFIDSYPAIMLFIWKIFDWIISGPLLMLLTQLSIYFFAVFTITQNINNNNLYSYRNYFKIFTFFILIFFPAIYPSLGLVSSNIWMNVFLLLGFAHYLNQTHLSSHKKYLYLLFSLTCYALAVLFQTNAVIAVLPLLVLNFYDYFKRSFLKCFFMSVLLAVFFLSNVILINYFFSVRGQYIDSRLEFYDLAGISLHAKENLFKNDNFYLKNIDLNQKELEQNYSSINNIKFFINDERNLPQKLGEEEYIDLFFLWLYSIRTFPTAYFTHRYQVSRKLLGFDNTIVFDFYRKNPIHQRVFSDLGFEKTDLRSKKKGLYSFYERFNQKQLMKPFRYFLLGLFFILFSVYVLFLRFKGNIKIFPQKYLILMMLSLSGILFEITFFFTAQSASFQHSFWMIMSTLLCIVVIPSKTSFLSE